MVVNSAAFALFGCLSIQLFSVKTCQAYQCIPDLFYMCGTPQIEATADRVALVAPGRPPGCVLEAANCSTLITARPGEKITVTLNTGISISPCDDSNYVQFSDGTATSRRYCQESSPPPFGTTSATSWFGPLFTSSGISMSVTYRSRSGGNFISIYFQAVGCPHDELIEGDNHQIQEEAFHRVGYSVNVSCDPGYLLSNTTSSISAKCRYIASTQSYRWSISSRYQCQGFLCSSPPSIPNGWFTSNDGNYTYLTSVTYACNTGYHLNGTSTRQCITENRIAAKWSGAAPSCTVVDCGPPSIPNADSSAPLNTSYGAEFHYICNSRYVPTGLKTARCLENSHWSYVSCEEVQTVDLQRGVEQQREALEDLQQHAAIFVPVLSSVVLIMLILMIVMAVRMKRIQVKNRNNEWSQSTANRGEPSSSNDTQLRAYLGTASMRQDQVYMEEDISSLQMNSKEQGRATAVMTNAQYETLTMSGETRIYSDLDKSMPHTEARR